MSRLFGPIRQNGYVVRDIEAAMAHWIDVLQIGPWFYIERGGEQGRFAYFDTGAPVGVYAGTVVEISDISGNKGRFFDHIRERARTWDGSDPIRRPQG